MHISDRVVDISAQSLLLLLSSRSPRSDRRRWCVKLRSLRPLLRLARETTQADLIVGRVCWNAARMYAPNAARALAIIEVHQAAGEVVGSVKPV